MKTRSVGFGLVNGMLASVMLLPLGTIFLWSGSVNAQVTSDGSLNTSVSQNGNNFTITNGSAAGSNLFHSFGQFSVPTGGSATFNLSDIRDMSAYRKTQKVQAQILTAPEVLVQATSWHRNAQGKIELVADKSPAQVQQPLTCAAVPKI
ncbi:MAG: hypothetical protein V7K62_12540 [Nostoc sp.]